MKRILLGLVLFLSACAFNPTPQELAEQLRPHVVVLARMEGDPICSGVAVAPTKILTAKHCIIEGLVGVHVRTMDGKTHRIVDTKKSATYDAAIITIDAPALVPARIGDSRAVRIGDSVIAVGHPLGQEWSVTFGLVSKIDSLGTAVSDDNAGLFLQITAMIYRTSSGGALFNARGELIGLTNWGFPNTPFGYALRLEHALELLV